MLTIVTPTRNRPGFIKNQLEYFARSGLTYRWIIVDGSDADYVSRNKVNIEKYQNSLNVEHFVPARGTSEFFLHRIFFEISQTHPLITTPFVSVVNDDDYYVLDGLDAVVEHISQDESICICSGLTVIVDTGEMEGGITGKLEFYRGPSPVASQHDPLDRVVALLAGYNTIGFSVQKTETFFRSIELIRACEAPSLYIEVAQALLAVAQGRSVQIPQWYLARHMHHRTSSKGIAATGIDIFHEDFSADFRTFTDTVLDGMRVLGCALPTDTMDRFKAAFSRYLVIRKVVSWPKDLTLFAPPDHTPLIRKILARSDDVRAPTELVLSVVRRNVADALGDDRADVSGI